MARGDLEQKIAAWMRGRNGSDELSAFVLVVAFILLVLNIFLNTLFLTLVAVALIGYAWWRMSSRNIEDRESENATFVGLAGPLGSWLRNPGAAIAESREYKHFKCPECGQRVRVPRKKGKLRITCPQCHHKFEART